MSDFKIIMSYEIHNFWKSVRKIYNSSEFYTVIGFIVILLTINIFKPDNISLFIMFGGLVLFGWVVRRYDKDKISGEFRRWDSERKGVYYKKNVTEKERKILIQVGKIQHEQNILKDIISKGD